MYLLDICASSSEKCMLYFIAHLLIQLFAHLLLNVYYLYILDINHLLGEYLTKVFSHSVGCVFILLTISFAMLKLSSLMQSHLSSLTHISWTIGSPIQKNLATFIISSNLTYHVWYIHKVSYNLYGRGKLFESLQIVV
jgi:hypothetical protein